MKHIVLKSIKINWLQGAYFETYCFIGLCVFLSPLVGGRPSLLYIELVLSCRGCARCLYIELERGVKDF